MLPPIPQRLLRVDEITFGQHFSLDGTETCFYIWEYAARQRYDFSPSNQLVKNLKIKPSEIDATPSRRRYKQGAIDYCAQAFRALFPTTWVENQATFVALPSSKVRGHPDFDDRTQRILETAFHGRDADIRPLLKQTCSTTADHETEERLSYGELRAITQLDESQVALSALRTTIVVVDDVLNSGKHFRVALDILSSRFPSAKIIGVFIARCVRLDPP